MSKRFVFWRLFLGLPLIFGFCGAGNGEEEILPEIGFDASLSYTSSAQGPLIVAAKKEKKKKDRRSKKSKSRSQKNQQEQEKKDEAKKVRDPEKDLYQWFQTYAEIVSLVQRKGFRTVDFSKFIQNSLKAAVANVDAHSAFFDQDSYKAALESTSGEFSGIGVSIISKTPEDDALVVVDVIQGSPADKAGMKSGDKIVEVNKEKLRGLSTDEAVNKLKGKVGTEVALKVLRSRRPMEFKVMRDIIKDQTSICYYFEKQNVYYLSLTLFAENAATQMAELLKKANEGKCKGIVLDLRRNPGGTLDSAIDMAGLFLPKNSLVVVTKNNRRKVSSEYFTKTEPLLQSDVPIFILINNFTASAAEILAGCLAYHSQHSAQEEQRSGSVKKAHKKGGRSHLMVFLVGTSTFGKGSVQELMPIKNGCALKLTTMLYFLPGNLSLQATGIQPDFLVRPKMIPVDELKWINEFYGKETALKNFITSKEVEEMYGIKPIKRIDEDAKDANARSSGLEDIVDFGDEGADKDLSGAGSLAKDDKEKTPKDWEAERQKNLALDVQVQACVNMINMLNFARKTDPELVASHKKALEFLKGQYLTDEPAKLVKVM